ncbi:MAG: hypothetical protein ACF8OB_02055 [Phycisphaeraceae bacterium JB051]
MMLKPSDAYTAQLTTHDPQTGQASNADILPTAIATRNGTDDASFVLTVTNLATGRYKITGNVPANYVNGDVVQIVVNAQVASTSDTAIIDHFVISSKHISDLADFDPTNQTVNVGKWANVNVTTTDFGVLSNLDMPISSRSSFDPTSDPVTVDQLSVNALSDFFTTNTGSTFNAAISGSLVKEIVDNVAISSGSSDWTSTEKEQIRFRLGLDGDTNTPANSGDLPDIKTILQAATRK